MTHPQAISRLRGIPLLTMRLVLGAVFLYAGYVKVGSAQAFADGIAAYRIVPAAWVNGLALSLPVFEMILGAWLMSGWRRRSAAFCAVFTLMVFLGALAAAELRGLRVGCACFGAVNPRGLSANGPLALIRDLVLAAAAWLLYAVAWRESRAQAPGADLRQGLTATPPGR